VKIEIAVTRNSMTLSGGWNEKSLADYLTRYVLAYGVTDRLRADFPEYDFAATVTR
jgi:hypothetical protein